MPQLTTLAQELDELATLEALRQWLARSATPESEPWVWADSQTPS